MPPFGLYAMPRNHLYGGRTKPKLFNTNDFKEEEVEVDRAADLNPTTPTGMDGTTDSFPAAVEAGKKKKADKAARKEKKKGEGLDRNAELERLLTSSVDRAGGDASSNKKKKKDKAKNRRSEGAAGEMSEVFQSTPAALVSAKKAQKNGSEKKTAFEKKPASEKKPISEKKPASEKKRKRESEVHSEAASTQLLNEEYLANQKLPAIVLESLRNFASPAPIPEPSTLEPTQPSKKKPKTKRKSEGEGDVPKVKKPRRKSEVETPIVKLDAAEHAPVPSDWIDGTDEKAVKTQKSAQVGVAQKDAAATVSSVFTSKKTPVPLPQISQKSFKIMGRAQKQNVDEGYTSEIVMVPETPPSHLSKKSHLFFPQNDTKGTAASKKTSKIDQQLISSPTPPANPPTSSLASPELGRSKIVPKLPSIPNALTDANLRSFKEPLNSDSKPRPRTKSGASTSSSIRTSSASMSIQEAFARVGKPYIRSAASNDPFTTSASAEKPKKKASHAREEAPLEVFKDKFHEVQKAVEWDAEDNYLKAYLEWDAAHRGVEPLCLHKMTGCTAKREALLRASVEQGMPIPSQLDTPPGDIEKVRGAVAEAERAEDLLMLATKARVPIPLGHISGRWTLYCPTYAAAHFDKYGYGSRTLVISSIAGFRSHSFTARLQLPPRTMSFALMMFTPPPHASFRATTIKTASEGYAVEVVFLGNGYLQMRLDLGLMLQGKSTEKAEGGGPMEFIGVHEKAMAWWGGEEGGVEDVEREGKRMFRKYDGE